MKVLNVGAALLPLVSGSAIPSKQPVEKINTFGIIALHSTSPIHLQSVNAAGTKFWIGKDTATYCPDIDGLDCSQFQNITAFSSASNSDYLGLVRPLFPLAQMCPKYCTDFAKFTGHRGPRRSIRLHCARRLSQFHGRAFRRHARGFAL